MTDISLPKVLVDCTTVAEVDEWLARRKRELHDFYRANLDGLEFCAHKRKQELDQQQGGAG